MHVRICGQIDPVPVVIPIKRPPTNKKRVKARAMAATFRALVRYETTTKRAPRIAREVERLAGLDG